MAKIEAENWGDPTGLKQNNSEPPEVAKTVEFTVSEPFKNRELLHQKYVIENLSASEIAAQFLSSRSTVLKYLKLHGIPVRGTGKGIRKKRNLAYGKRIVNRQEVAHQREQEIIRKMRSLRAEGLSYWKIASVLNAWRIPTKGKKAKWHARSVQQILDRADGKGDGDGFTD